MTSVAMRRHVERQIIRRLVLDAFSAGYLISVDNGEEEFTIMDRVKPVLDACFSVDEEHLHFYKDGRKVGWVFLVYGNSGYDVISDYSTNLEPIMAGADRLTEKYDG